MTASPRAESDAAFIAFAAEVRACGWPTADADTVIALHAVTTGHTHLLPALIPLGGAGTASPAAGETAPSTRGPACGGGERSAPGAARPPGADHHPELWVEFGDPPTVGVILVGAFGICVGLLAICLLLLLSIGWVC